MSSATSGGTLDLDALRQGMEGRNLEAIMSLYADDAEISIVDQEHTPSHPQVVRGRDQIRAFLADVFGRDITHHVDHVVSGDGTVSFMERCVYPDGSRVLATAVLDVDAGRIIRQEEVQAWDPGMPEAGYKEFSQPDEVRTFEKGRLELIHTPAGDIGRMVLSPGWRWSEHVRPIAGTDLCQASHAGYQISGRLRIQLADGTTYDAEPGMVGFVPPGHDAWVMGDEPAVLLDWAGATNYARLAAAPKPKYPQAGESLPSSALTSYVGHHGSDRFPPSPGLSRRCRHPTMPPCEATPPRSRRATGPRNHAARPPRRLGRRSEVA